MRAARRRKWGSAVLVMLVCGMVLAAGGVASPSAGADLAGRTVYLCFGEEATIVGTARGETLYGTAGDDVIVGLAGGDTIIGYEGDDLICGGGGKDVITPGPGINRVKGGPGDDVIAGGPRRDVVRAGGGDDIVNGGGGPDRLFGQTGNDRLLGGDRNDYLNGGDGNDYLNGELGDDYLDGGLGTDTCYGETKLQCELPASALNFESGTVHRFVSSSTDAISTITVSGSGTITDLNVGLVITHTWVGDLVVTLTHVDTGTFVTMVDRPGTTVLPPPGSSVGDFGCGSNNIDATLDDEASALVEDMCRSTYPAISGPVRPNHPLSAFDGEDIGGTWRLKVTDGATLDSGYLEEWSLHFQT